MLYIAFGPPRFSSRDECAYLRFDWQVDNLRSIDTLEEEISETAVVMIFASKGYFQSKSEPSQSHPARR